LGAAIRNLGSALEPKLELLLAEASVASHAGSQAVPAEDAPESQTVYFYVNANGVSLQLAVILIAFPSSPVPLQLIVE